jgi:creatinine amidohydrolase
MRHLYILLAATSCIAGTIIAQQPRRESQEPQRDKGWRLEDVAWTEAERRLLPDTVVVVPLGAASKEHGPHLKLRNDLTLAEYLTKRVVASADVAVAPTISYHFYPAFLEYPGSTSLSLATARDLTVEVVRSLARYGPRRFYVLNTGISTLRPLAESATLAAQDGTLLRYTDLSAKLANATRQVQQQPLGSHADEIETSMMLYIDAASVDMTKAARELAPRSTPMRLTRQQGSGGTYSPTGVWGDATLATREKGRVLVEALVDGILAEIEETRKAPLPTAQPGASPQPEQPRIAPPMRGQGEVVPPGRCSSGDERMIRLIGDRFSVAWTDQDANRLASLWAADGDIVHPDGMTERSPHVIRQNRAHLFAQKGYAGSRHPLTLNNIRCPRRDFAVADGKWELRGVTDGKGQRVRTVEGLVTVVARRGPDGWLIEAYRYTINQPGHPAPTLLKRPGVPNVIR